MLLLRQLPAGPISFHVPVISFLPEKIPSPSYSSILLSLLASLVLISFLRAAVLCLRNNIGKKALHQAPVQVEEKQPTERSNGARPSRLSWTFFSWERISAVSLSLPVALAPVDKESMGKGVGMQQRRVDRPIERWQPQRTRRGGPTFETPLPALYQSEEPLSMAKMIMSRHTFRKPTGRPPARVVTPPSRKQASSPPPSSSPPPPTQPSNPPSMV